MTTQTITKSLTIPAREVRPGDVLFGMTVSEARSSRRHDELWVVFFADSIRAWLGLDDQVTVERPVPSDPIGTVRAAFSDHDGLALAAYIKVSDVHWRRTGVASGPEPIADADVADFPILWKPGMPIPSAEV